jgi:hypothetical protein
MKLCWAFLALSVYADIGPDEVMVRSDGLESSDGINWEKPKGPRVCRGKKIPDEENGKWICKRNLDKEGNKKGAGRKCRLKCENGFVPKLPNKAEPMDKNPIVKCRKEKGWKKKPKKANCVPE